MGKRVSVLSHAIEDVPTQRAIRRLEDAVNEALVAPPALVQTASGATWSSGRGTPEGSVLGNVGDLFTNTDGGASTTLYVKTSGTGKTGWTAK